MCPVKRDLAISNLKKYTLRGTNHHQFLLAIPTVLTYTYLPVSVLSIVRVNIPILTVNTNVSRHIVTLDTTHVSALQTRL